MLYGAGHASSDAIQSISERLATLFGSIVAYFPRAPCQDWVLNQTSDRAAFSNRLGEFLQKGLNKSEVEVQDAGLQHVLHVHRRVVRSRTQNTERTDACTAKEMLNTIGTVTPLTAGRFATSIVRPLCAWSPVCCVVRDR